MRSFSHGADVWGLCGSCARTEHRYHVVTFRAHMRTVYICLLTIVFRPRARQAKSNARFFVIHRANVHGREYTLSM